MPAQQGAGIVGEVLAQFGFRQAPPLQGGAQVLPGAVEALLDGMGGAARKRRRSLRQTCRKGGGEERFAAARGRVPPKPPSGAARTRPEAEPLPRPAPHPGSPTLQELAPVRDRLRPVAFVHQQPPLVTDIVNDMVARAPAQPCPGIRRGQRSRQHLLREKNGAVLGVFCAQAGPFGAGTSQTQGVVKKIRLHGDSLAKNILEAPQRCGAYPTGYCFSHFSVHRARRAFLPWRQKRPGADAPGLPLNPSSTPAPALPGSARRPWRPGSPTRPP